MPAQTPEDGYLLIITYGRSGSTLLQNILLSIDGYSIRGENHNVLVPVFEAYRRALATKTGFGKKVKTRDKPWYGADKVRPAEFGSRLVDAFIDEVLVPDPGARVIGFKEIRYGELSDEDFPEFIDFVRTFLKPCRIIFNMRRPADVANSAWFRARETGEVIDEISRYDALYRAYAEQHPNDCFLLQYEDYCSDVEGLQPLFNFLGEDLQPDRLEKVLATELNHCKQ